MTLLSSKKYYSRIRWGRLNDKCVQDWQSYVWPKVQHGYTDTTFSTQMKLVSSLRLLLTKLFNLTKIVQVGHCKRKELQFLCSELDWNREKTLTLIGHPRCLKNVKKFPVITYTAERLRWHSSSFEAEVRQWDRNSSNKSKKFYS